MPYRACLQITQHYIYALKLPSQINLFSSKIFPPTKIYNIKVPPHPKFLTYVYITGLHKLASNTLSTCVIRCNTNKNK